MPSDKQASSRRFQVRGPGCSPCTQGHNARGFGIPGQPSLAPQSCRPVTQRGNIPEQIRRRWNQGVLVSQSFSCLHDAGGAPGVLSQGTELCSAQRHRLLCLEQRAAGGSGDRLAAGGAVAQQRKCLSRQRRQPATTLAFLGLLDCKPVRGPHSPGRLLGTSASDRLERASPRPRGGARDPHGLHPGASADLLSD